MSPSLKFRNAYELHTEIHITLTPGETIHWNSCFPFLYHLLIQDTETSCYEGLIFALQKKKSSLCAHILILPTDLSVNSIWQVGNLFFLKNHNSFSAVPLYYYTFYTGVHRKHCCFFNNSIPSSNHSCKGAAWESLGTGWVNCGRARKPRESWEENTRRGREEKASGGVGAGEETKTEGIIKWGDNCRRKQWELWRRKQHKNTIAGHPTAGSGVWAHSLPSKGISAMSAHYWGFTERGRKLFFHLCKGQLKQCQEEGLHKPHKWASQVAVVVKDLPTNARDIRDTGLIPGLGRSPGGGYGNPLQYSCLENPMDRGAWRAIHSMESQSQTQLKHLSTHACELHMHKSETCPHRSLFYWSPWGRSRKDLWGLSRQSSVQEVRITPLCCSHGHWRLKEGRWGTRDEPFPTAGHSGHSAWQPDVHLQSRNRQRGRE